MSEPVAVRECEPADMDTADAALCTVADRLTAHGFDVLVPAEQAPGQLLLTNVRDALCELNLTSSKTMVWMHRPFYGALVSPEAIAGKVMVLLGLTGATGRGLPAEPSRGPGLKGAVGGVLAACGLRVCLKVIYRDDANCEIYSATEVTNPAELARGNVQVGDDAAIRWECAVGDAATGAAGLSAADVVQVISHALVGRGA